MSPCRLQVTVIAVMQRLGANEDLYAVVFGESCLNDAVGIVLYRTLTIFLHEVRKTPSSHYSSHSACHVLRSDISVYRLPCRR